MKHSICAWCLCKELSSNAAYTCSPPADRRLARSSRPPLASSSRWPTFRVFSQLVHGYRERHMQEAASQFQPGKRSIPTHTSDLTISLHHSSVICNTSLGRHLLPIRISGNCKRYAEMVVVKDDHARSFKLYYSNVIADGNKRTYSPR